MALHVEFEDMSDGLYTDAAEYDFKTAHTAAVVRCRQCLAEPSFLI